MVNIGLFLLIYFITLALSIFTYTRNAKKLITYHKYSFIIDILSFISGLGLIILSFLFYDSIPKYNFLLIGQMIAGSSLLNIHLVRFFVHLRTP
jgi:hypothetical protein